MMDGVRRAKFEIEGVAKILGDNVAPTFCARPLPDMLHVEEPTKRVGVNESITQKTSILHRSIQIFQTFEGSSGCLRGA